MIHIEIKYSTRNHDFSNNIIPIVDHFISNFCLDILNHDFLINQLKQLIAFNNLEKITIENDKFKLYFKFNFFNISHSILPLFVKFNLIYF